MTPDPHWRKATRSENGANCVEVHHTLDALRDAKNPTGPVLHTDVRALITAVRAHHLPH